MREPEIVKLQGNRRSRKKNGLRDAGKPRMDDRFKKWFYLSISAWVMIAIGLMIYPYLDPIKPISLARALVLRGTLFLFGVFALTSALVLTDSVTPGDWLERVGNEPLSCSILLSALVIGLAWMYCYA